MRDVLTWALVGAGVAVQVFACLGVMLMRDALDRLHYVGASAVGVPLLAAAVIVSEGPSLIGIKALLTAAFMLVTGPVLGHASARAIHLHREARR
ncbi:MAG: multicomponent Na+:H+ antiporter subunit [Solirubrobacteraceae bacterium]|nr:multicomponent Na+:H+ antiporter subunit [Solirubrobacteraceae bacterium]